MTLLLRRPSLPCRRARLALSQTAPLSVRLLWTHARVDMSPRCTLMGILQLTLAVYRTFTCPVLTTTLTRDIRDPAYLRHVY